jgi:phosphoketolase
MKLNKKNATGKRLSTELLSKIRAHWRAVSYLSVGQNHLYDHPLLKKPRELRAEHPHGSRRREKDFASARLISILQR